MKQPVPLTRVCWQRGFPPVGAAAFAYRQSVTESIHTRKEVFYIGYSTDF